MKILKVLVCVLVLLSTFALGNQQKNLDVEKQEIDITHPVSGNPLKLVVWYPAGLKEDQTCKNVMFCLSKSTNTALPVIISHGAGGSTREFNWIGYATASQGMVTIGINHYGESWVYGQDTVKPNAFLEMWNRPVEVSQLLDLLEKNTIGKKPVFNQKLNWSNTTMIGFSSGGSTVMSLAGATYDPLRALNYCNSKKSVGDLGCEYMKGKEDLLKNLDLDKAKASYHDQRVRRTIALDPAAGHLTNQDSLKSISIPTLIIAAKQSDFLPFDTHAGYYASNLMNNELVTLNRGEGHFVFIDQCDLDIKVHGIEVCSDKEGIDRKAVHNSLYPHIFSFIYRTGF